jgi:hypothetical protein
VADFAVTADNHAYVVVPGKPTEITLSVARQQGFAEDIDFAIVGLPESVTASPCRSAHNGQASKSVKLVLNATGGAFSGPVRINAQSAGASKLARPATWPVPGLNYSLRDFWLTVVAPSQ